VAYLIESLVPAIVGGVLASVLPAASGTTRAVLSILGALVVVAWAILVVYLQAEKAAGPGMRLMKLQLVGFYDGRPIGWGRVLLRAVLLWLLSATGIGLLIMLITMLLHPRRQGWHDRAANAVVIRERVLAPPPDRLTGGQPASLPQPSYGPVTGYSAIPGGQSAAQPVPNVPPEATGYPPAGYPGGGYPPGANPYPAGDYPQRVPESHPQVQPTPVPAAPTPAVVAPTGAPPSVVPAPRPDPGYRQPSPQPSSAPSAPPPDELRPPATDWVAVLDDGRRVNIDRLVLLGRNPRPQPGEEDAQLVKIADETRTVSKLHLAIGVDQAGLYVVDRGSTNGSTVTNPGGASKRCQPGDVVYVGPGTIVSMGDHWLEIRRGDQ
jgi:uncharacterized RDD family membrane protein YckC